jgi:hypothetical protein
MEFGAAEVSTTEPVVEVGAAEFVEEIGARSGRAYGDVWGAGVELGATKLICTLVESRS